MAMHRATNKKLRRDTNFLVFGGTGLFGAPLVHALADRGHRVTVVARSRKFAESKLIRSLTYDVSSGELVGELLRELDPTWVINCAAETNVDACESSARARRLNVKWPQILAAAVASSGARLVHVSTDSVFTCRPDDPRPVESDARHPLNAYARQKAQAEDAVLDASEGKALVLRTNFFGWPNKARHGLAAWALCELRRGRGIVGFSDVYFNPLYTGDAIDLLVQLLTKEVEGVVHLLGSQCLSKLSFLRSLAKAFSLDMDLVEEGQLGHSKLTAPRPSSTCLATERLEDYIGRRPPSAQQGLQRMVQEEAMICSRLASIHA